MTFTLQMLHQQRLEREYKIVASARKRVAKGWTRGRYVRNEYFGTEDVCALGALRLEVFGNPYADGPRDPDYVRICGLFRDLVTGGKSVWRWNDRQRNVRPVLEGFDIVLEHLAAEIVAGAGITSEHRKPPRRLTGFASLASVASEPPVTVDPKVVPDEWPHDQYLNA